MEYYRIAQREKKQIVTYKFHIKSENEKFLCGLSMSSRYIKETDSIISKDICENCLKVANDEPFSRNQTFWKVVVDKLTEQIDFESKEFKSEFSKACIGLTGEYEALGLSCEYVVDHEYDDVVMGRVLLNTPKYKNTYMKFTYKPRNVIKLRFEKPLRDYLTLYFQDVVGME